jgi:hypothetical protein
MDLIVLAELIFEAEGGVAELAAPQAVADMILLQMFE